MTAKEKVRGYKLPEQLTDHDLIHLCIALPKDPDYFRAFWAQFYDLTRWFSWEHTPNITTTDRRAKIAADYWLNKIYLPNEEAYFNGERCEPENDYPDCIDYATTSQVITWEPKNPHSQPGQIPLGYVSAPWKIYKSPIFPGTQPGDIYSTNLFNSGLFAIMAIVFGLVPLLPGFLVSGFPRFKVRFTGAKTVQLHLLAIPQGGLAMITIDGNPLSTEFVDLASIDVADADDYIAFLELLTSDEIDGGLVSTTIVELVVEGEGEHYVDVTMVPKVSNENVIVGFGGGVRKIVMCGDFEPEYEPEIRISPDGSCVQWKNPFTNTWECKLPLPPTVVISPNECCCECCDENDLCDENDNEECCDNV